MRDKTEHPNHRNGDDLYHRLTSEVSITAADSLFAAAERELIESFNEGDKLAPIKSDSK